VSFFSFFIYGAWGIGCLLWVVGIVSLRIQTNPENKAEFSSVSNERYDSFSCLCCVRGCSTPGANEWAQGIRGFRLREHASPLHLRQFHQLANITCIFSNLERETTLGYASGCIKCPPLILPPTPLCNPVKRALTHVCTRKSLLELLNPKIASAHQSPCIHDWKKRRWEI
jgi:hypothetical protein